MEFWNFEVVFHSIINAFVGSRTNKTPISGHKTYPFSYPELWLKFLMFFEIYFATCSATKRENLIKELITFVSRSVIEINLWVSLKRLPLNFNFTPKSVNIIVCFFKLLSSSVCTCLWVLYSKNPRLRKKLIFFFNLLKFSFDYNTSIKIEVNNIPQWNFNEFELLKWIEEGRFILHRTLFYAQASSGFLMFYLHISE